MTEGDLPLKAIPLWQEAGVCAASRAAHVEATSHFLAALNLLGQVENRDERLQHELLLRTQLALSLSASQGYAASGVQAAYGRAREICTVLGNKAEHFPVLRGLCTFYIVRNELLIARALAQQCTRIGEETQRPEYLIEGYNALGYVLVFMGDLATGRSLLEKAVQIYQSNAGEHFQFQTDQDPRVACLSLLAIVCWVQGAFELAVPYRDQALAAARISIIHSISPMPAALLPCSTTSEENSHLRLNRLRQPSSSPVNMDLVCGWLQMICI